MKKEWVLLVILIIIAGWWFLSKPKEEVPVVRCPPSCEYGCLPGTSQCRELPPLACPSTCLWGCFPNTTECKPEPLTKENKTRCGSVIEDLVIKSNIHSESTCLAIQADNLTINCNGFRITGGKTSSYGVYVAGRKNITIINCVIEGFETGVLVESSSDITLSRIITSKNFKTGISVKNSNNVTLKQIIALDNDKIGIELNYSNQVVFSNNRVSGSNTSITMEHSIIKDFSNNVLCSGISDAVDMLCNDVVFLNARNNECSFNTDCEVRCILCIPPETPQNGKPEYTESAETD